LSLKEKRRNKTNLPADLKGDIVLFYNGRVQWQRWVGRYFGEEKCKRKKEYTRKIKEKEEEEDRK